MTLMTNPQPQLIPFGATVKVASDMRDRDTALCPLFDPAVVSFTFYKPDGTTTTLVYGTDAAVQKSSVGKYTCEILGDQSGVWTYDVTSSGPAGAPPIGKDDGTFSVGLDPSA